MTQTVRASAPRPTTAAELREAFLKFFEDRGHLRLPAASLIPANDPTLLLTNSGMAQFKQYFSGELESPRGRITTAQKSFRTTDIESVGDATHLTLFEMMGNFSFGDYFKKEACAWALELMTQVLKFPAERLYFTVFESDDEAAEIWRGLGVPADHIYRFGAKDNFWGPAGTEGPCGPCSEVHYYNGDLSKVPAVNDPVRTTQWGPNIHRDFVELYNLVFTQLYHHQDGRRTELPKKNIDTGMGLERVLVVLQGVNNVYEIDSYRPLIECAEKLSGREWGQDIESSRALSVVAEHSRSAAFLIGDGVVPGNTGRGYVLRRLIRRAMLFGRQIGLRDTFMPELAGVAGEVMGGAYPELVRNGPFINRVLRLEEERFSKTLEFGTSVLDGMIEYRRAAQQKLPALHRAVRTTPSRSETAPFDVLAEHGLEPVTGDEPRSVGMRAAAMALAETTRLLASSLATGGRRGTAEAVVETRASEQAAAAWASAISGSEAFLLYDTYGFPIEITRELVEQAQLTVDTPGFESAMTAQRERGRAAGAKFGGDTQSKRVYEELGSDVTPFLGYHATSAESVVLGIVRGGELVQSASEGDEIEIVLRETPFYAEKGGQVGDTGELRADGVAINVRDTQNPYAHLVSHNCIVSKGRVGVGDAVRAEVNVQRRDRIRRNHTATHLLHAALREILGEHVRQAGSLVAPDRMRFDFTHMTALTPAEMKAAQDRVNEQIRANQEVHTEHTTYAAAIQKGALAFFGDKYEHDVRAVCIVGAHERDGHVHKDECWSYELCGGTHMDRTGGVGTFVIIAESGIGAGLRRIEALTGSSADDVAWERTAVLSRLSASLRAPVTELESRMEALQKELDAARRKLTELEDKVLQASLGGTGAQQARTIEVTANGATATVQIHKVTAANTEALRRAGDLLRDKLGSGIVITGSIVEGQPAVVVMVSRDLTASGFHAGNIARGLAALMGGGGGGRADVAQAGGKEASKLDDALASAERVIRESLASGAKK